MCSEETELFQREQIARKNTNWRYLEPPKWVFNNFANPGFVDGLESFWIINSPLLQQAFAEIHSVKNKLSISAYPLHRSPSKCSVQNYINLHAGETLLNTPLLEFRDIYIFRFKRTSDRIINHEFMRNFLKTLPCKICWELPQLFTIVLRAVLHPSLSMSQLTIFNPWKRFCQEVTDTKRP